MSVQVLSSLSDDGVFPANSQTLSAALDVSPREMLDDRQQEGLAINHGRAFRYGPMQFHKAVE